MSNNNVEKFRAVIEWRTRGRTPQAIFGLQPYDCAKNLHSVENCRSIGEFSDLLEKPYPLKVPPYDENQINTAYKRLMRQYHTDKTPDHKALATLVTILIGKAKAYLLYTLDPSNEAANQDIEDNIFYKYYHLGLFEMDGDPNNEFEFLVRSICTIKETARGVTTEYLEKLKTLLSEHNDLLNYTGDSRTFSFTTSGKTILYLAAQWNEPNFFEWLLLNFKEPKKLDPFVKLDNPDISPMDIAINRGHGEIIERIRTHYGDEAVKKAFHAIFKDELAHNTLSALQCYTSVGLLEEVDYPSFAEQFPLLYPCLLQLGHITVDDPLIALRQKVIGCPFLYKKCTAEQRKDPFLIIAFLAQIDPKKVRGYDSIPFKALDPAFCVALADAFPNNEALSRDVKNALHRDGPPYPNIISYDDFKYLVKAIAVFVIACALLIHFWSSIIVLPEIVLVSLEIIAFAVVPVMPVIIVLAGSYLKTTYPKALEINTILKSNSFTLFPWKDPVDNASGAAGLHENKFSI